MRLADYKTKFFDYLAGSLRRLAEFLSVKSLTEKDDFAAEKTFSPVENWMEKTRNVAPEQWFEFSGENESEPPSAPPNSSFDDKAVEDFVLEKPEKQPPIETSLESKRDSAGRLEASNNSEISLTGKPKKPKGEARFFSFNPADKKPTGETGATAARQSKISRGSSAEDEKPLAATRRKFRLLPSELISKNNPKKPNAPAPGIINFSENQPPPKFEIPTFERKKSAVKMEEGVPSKPKKTIETAEPIIKKSSARELPSEIPLEAFSRKNESETAPEINFEFPKREATDEAVFTSKIKEAEETPNFSALRKKSRNIVQEYLKPERVKKNDGIDDKTKNFVVAESPWIDLPDEPAFEASGDIQINFSENEHRRFLEREQAGEI